MKLPNYEMNTQDLIIMRVAVTELYKTAQKTYPHAEETAQMKTTKEKLDKIFNDHANQ